MACQLFSVVSHFSNFLNFVYWWQFCWTKKAVLSGSCLALLYIFCHSISRRIAGPGEIFSSDFRAGARSPRWATRCFFGSATSSCIQKFDHRSASELSAKRAAKTLIDFAEQIETNSSKSLASYVQSKKRKSKVVKTIVERKKKQPNRPAKGVHVDLPQSIVDLLSVGRCRSLSKSVVFGFFKFFAYKKKFSTIHKGCLFFFD